VTTPDGLSASLREHAGTGPALIEYVVD